MAPKFKPNREITKLAGESESLFQSLAKRLSERTGELSPEAAESIRRLSSEEQVALDEFLSEGGKMGEVRGEGLDAKAGPVWPPAMGEREAERLARSPNVFPTAPTSDMYRAQQQNSLANEVPATEHGRRVGALNDTDDTARGPAARGRRQGWPEPWRLTENIPGLAAGAVGAGVLLGSGEAKAAPGYKPNRGISPLAGESQSLFRSLTNRLQERTGPLSPEAAASLQRLNPDEQVALDEFLSGGGSVGEVQGTGVGVKGPVWDATAWERDPRYGGQLGPTSTFDPNVTPNVVDAPDAPAVTRAINNTPGTTWAGAARTFDVRNQNFNQNTPSSYPTRAWENSENIPGIAGGLTVGGLLASQRAEAATQQEAGAAQQSRARALTQLELRVQQAVAAKQREENLKSPNAKVRGAQLLRDAQEGNLQVAPGMFDLINKFDQHVVKPLMHFNQFAVQNWLYGGPSPELQESIAKDVGAVGFKPESVPYDPNKPGNIHRQVQPQKALMFERFFKHVIGPTDWNTGDPSLTLGNLVPGMTPGKDAAGDIDRLSPAARAVIENMGERHGMAAAAGILSLTQWGRDLPFWLMPAGDAKGSIASQALLGAAAGMADPEGSAEMGATAGAMFGVGGKAVAALLKQVRGGPKVDVVAVMDAASDAQLIESMARSISGEMPAVTPKGRTRTADLPMVVVDLENGRRAALVQDHKGLVQTMPFYGDVPADVPHLTNEGKRLVDGEVQEFKGLVVTAKDGKLQMHHADSVDLHATLFKARKPVEVTLPDGSTKVGFIKGSDGTTVTVGQAAGESLPSGVGADMQVDPKSVRPLPEKEADGLARQQAQQNFDEEVIGKALNDDPAATTKVLMAAHAESGQSVIPSKTGALISDAEASVANGGGVPPGQRLEVGPLPDGDPKMLPANAGPAGQFDPKGVNPNHRWVATPTGDMRFIPDPSAGWARSVWGAFLKGGKVVGDKFLHPTHTLPDDLREIGMRQASLHTFEELRQPLHDSIISKIGGFNKMSPVEKRQALALINQFVNGTLSPESLQGSMPGLGPALVDYLKIRENQIRANEQLVNDLGMKRLGHKLDPDEPLRGQGLPDEAQAYWKRVQAAGGELPDYIKPSAATGKLEYTSPAGGEWVPPAPGEASPNEFYKWAPNIYLSKMLPEGEWAKQFRKDAHRYKDARNELFKLLKAENTSWDDTVLMGHAERWLEDMIAGGDGTIAAHSSLKPRLKSMPLWVRDALGEVNNGAIRIADAEARQQNLIHRGLIYKMVSENPALSVRPSSFDLELQRMGWKRLEGNFGLANGMLVRPDVHEVLTNLPSAMSQTNGWIARLTGIMKWNFTVANPPTWALNVAGNTQNAILSNLVNPLNPLDFGHIGWASKEAVKDLVSVPFRPSNAKAMPAVRINRESGRMLRAQELGILGSDSANADFRTSIREWHTLLMDEARNPNIFEASANAGMGGVNKLSKMYGSIDPLFKYTTWMAGLKKWGVNGQVVDRKKALKALKDNGLLKGWLDTLNEKQRVSLMQGEYTSLLPNSKIRRMLEVEAAKRIHSSFPMVDRLGQWPSKVAASPYAMLATNAFFRTSSEMLRVWGSLPKRMVSEPGMAKSALYTTAFMAGIAGLVKYQRTMNGIDDEYIEAVWSSATPSQRKFRPGSLSMPGRNEDGSLDFIDFTKLIEPLRYLVGSPEDNPVKRVGVNLATLPIGGSLLDGALREGAYRTGWLEDKPFITDPAEWERQSGTGAFANLARAGAIPGVFSSIYRAMERGGVGFEARTSASMGGVEPQPKWMSAINAVMGGDFITRVGTPSQVRRARSAMFHEYSALMRQYIALAYKTEGQSTGPLTMPLDKKRAMEVQKAALLEKIEAFQAAMEKLDRISPPSSGVGEEYAPGYQENTGGEYDSTPVYDEAPEQYAPATDTYEE